MITTTKLLQLYSRLLLLYPKAYRDQFGDPILQTTADLLEGTASNKEQLITWFRIACNMPLDIVRQQLKYLGDPMKNTAYRLFVSILWIAVCIGACLVFPHLRMIGRTWINNAGFFRLIGLVLFIFTFVVTPFVLAVLALFNRPKIIYHKLLG